MTLTVSKLSNNCYYLHNPAIGLEELHLCPCCGLPFKTEESALLVAKAIKEDKFSWETAMTMQRLERETTPWKNL